MLHKAKAIVLDSWAIMSYLENEKSAEKVAQIISDACENAIPLKMSIVNLGEIWYIIAREVSVIEAEKTIQELKELGIEFLDADWPLTKSAAIYKAKHRMSYADCFAAALAKNEKAILITGDKEFKQVEDEIKIHWLEN